MYLTRTSIEQSKPKRQNSRSETKIFKVNQKIITAKTLEAFTLKANYDTNH